MTSSTLDPDNFPVQRGRKTPKGHDVKALGPSDSSDTGADVAGSGLPGMDDTSDRSGTGEGRAPGNERNTRADADIGFDRVVGPEEAGLGGGLDQAEEAWAGTTDEEPEE